MAVAEECKRKCRNYIEQYNHHGKNVFVKSKLKGKHKEYCLCYSCEKLDLINNKNNCDIAKEVYSINLKHNILTPVWECPEYVLKL